MKFVSIALSIILIACANPKAPTPGGGGGGNDKPGACGITFKKSKDCASIRWITAPVADSTPGVFDVEFTANGQAYDIASTLKIYASMDAMPHTSDVKVMKVPNTTGVYRASNVFLEMGGDWKIKFQLVNGSTVIDEATIPYSL